MIKYLLLFLLPFSLFASKILSYNIYDRTDRADLMITFDTPYNGVIKESRTNSKIIIRLKDASIEAPKIKKVSSHFLHSIAITPMKNETQIIASVPKSVKLMASKTSDGYGLRLRFTNKTAAQQTTLTKNATPSTSDSLSNLPTKKDDNLTRSYSIVIAILIIGILILFYIKKKTTPQLQKNNQSKQQKTPWLFNANEKKQQNTKTQQTDATQNTNNEVAIRFQKAIDTHNSVVMLDFGKESYLVLMGNSNILLDKFHENRPSSQQEFESILQSRHEELENFLNNNETSSREAVKEPLQAYKERAASLIYNDEF
jgi:preprotein translocase subunit SecG